MQPAGVSKSLTRSANESSRSVLQSDRRLPHCQNHRVGWNPDPSLSCSLGVDDEPFAGPHDLVVCRGFADADGCIRDTSVDGLDKSTLHRSNTVRGHTTRR